MEKRQKMENQKVGYTTKDWMLRFVKGMFIGSGFILPGVSGGALAAVFGMYERLISFLAHITKNFKENVLFFLPVGLGGVTGIFLLSFLVSFLLGAYETTILWFFVGCIVGTVPALWKEAGKKGRDTSDVIIMVVTFVLAYLFLLYGARLFDGQVDQNFGTWLIAGGLIGLGMIVPGLSPSNLHSFPTRRSSDLCVYIWDCTKRWLTDLKKFGLKSSCRSELVGFFVSLACQKSWIIFSQRHTVSYSILF